MQLIGWRHKRDYGVIKLNIVSKTPPRNSYEKITGISRRDNQKRDEYMSNGKETRIVEGSFYFEKI